MKNKQSKLAKIFKRDGRCCRYCGLKLDEKTAEVEHVLAKSKGGKDKLENLVAACSRCNRLKWHYSVGEFYERIQSKLDAIAADYGYYKMILERRELPK